MTKVYESETVPELLQADSQSDLKFHLALIRTALWKAPLVIYEADGERSLEEAGKGTSLFKRLSDHRKLIEASENLNIEDFYCRFLTVDDIWIPLGESLLIQKYRPLWNSVVDGFVNHDPGAGRYKGARPSWDELHPGRIWAAKCAPPKLAQDEVLIKVKNHWDTRHL